MDKNQAKTSLFLRKETKCWEVKEKIKPQQNQQKNGHSLPLHNPPFQQNILTRGHYIPTSPLHHLQRHATLLSFLPFHPTSISCPITAHYSNSTPSHQEGLFRQNRSNIWVRTQDPTKTGTIQSRSPTTIPILRKARTQSPICDRQRPTPHMEQKRRINSRKGNKIVTTVIHSSQTWTT